MNHTDITFFNQKKQMKHPVHKNHSHINTGSPLSLNSNKCIISLVLKPCAMKAFQGAFVILVQDEHE
jgi:hypothetical protein